MYWLRSPDADEESAVRLALSSTPRYLGRAPDNDLVVDVPAVSARHAAVFVSGGRVFVEDLGSRNGTFVDRRRVRRRAQVTPGQAVVLGGAVRLVLGHSSDPQPAEAPARWLLEQLDGPVRWPVPPGALSVAPAPDGLGVVVRDASGERRLAMGEIAEIGGVRYRVVRSTSVASPSTTLDPGPAAPRWTLTVSMSTSAGASAALLAPGSEGVSWTAPSRVALLYLLARQLETDRESGLPVDQQGWCADPEVAVGLWGRQGAHRTLTVVVTRIRNDLRAAALDPWLIEKRTGHVRLRPTDLTVEVDP